MLIFLLRIYCLKKYNENILIINYKNVLGTMYRYKTIPYSERDHVSFPAVAFKWMLRSDLLKSHQMEVPWNLMYVLSNFLAPIMTPGSVPGIFFCNQGIQIIIHNFMKDAKNWYRNSNIVMLNISIKHITNV